MLTEDKILWFEDEPENTTDYGKRLQDNFKLCKANYRWAIGPTYTISAGIRYLLLSAFAKREEFPLPDVILLDSMLVNDADNAENIEEIQKLGLSEPYLKEDAIKCIKQRTGGAVLEFLGKHIYPSFPSRIKVVYLSKFDEKEIRNEHGGDILKNFPGLLNGYHSKQDNPDKLVSMLFDILNHPSRGYNFEQIRASLNGDADHLLGNVSDKFEWSNRYRLALTNLVQAGADKAWTFGKNSREDLKKTAIISSKSENYNSALQSHKQLPRALILAERGCGKESFAKALHKMWYSKTPDAPFVSVNIGGVPPWSAGIALQLRLFGGQQDRNQTPAHGCVPRAWNGTLLLDELGDAQKDVQDTLLRLIQEGEYEPALWDPEIWAAHCCFIGTTNRDLWEEGGFRTDLADRLGIHIIKIPPLREMKEDIPFWMTKIARETAAKLQPLTGDSVPYEFEFHDVAANVIQGYSFPGNLRELAHAIRRMQLSALSKPRIPLDIVVKEISRLITVKDDKESIIFSLPTTETELDDLLSKFVYYAQNGNASFSQSGLTQFVNVGLRTKTTEYKLKQHLENRFGITEEKLKTFLKDLGKKPGNTDWRAYAKRED